MFLNKNRPLPVEASGLGGVGAGGEGGERDPRQLSEEEGP